MARKKDQANGGSTGEPDVSAPRILLIEGEAEVAAARKRARVEVRRERNRYEHLTLGALDAAVAIAGLAEAREPTAVLIIPYDDAQLRGFDKSTVRVFRADEESKSLRPVWNSGINTELKFIWAKVQQPGRYVPIGLPRDRILQQTLRELAYQRRMRDTDEPEAAVELTRRLLDPWLCGDDERLDELRHTVTRLEVAMTGPPMKDIPMGFGGHPTMFPLPHGEDLDGFRARVNALRPSPQGLPEEHLFFPPEIDPPRDLPWPAPPEEIPRPLENILQRYEPWFFGHPLHDYVKWLISKDWPMYQHDVRHTGRASGVSSITSTTAGQLTQRFKVDLDGPINTKPSIADGYVYVGTSKYAAGGGTLYKIKQCSGAIVGSFPTTGAALYSISGIGGSPAVYKGKVYFTTVYGQVYCVDAATMTKNAPHPPAIWVTDLKNPDGTKKQPIRNPDGDCWTSLLVVNDRVYAGSGEGEVATCWGFIWCLDANTGEVLWVFCTNKERDINAPGNENQPNRIPRSAAVTDPLPAWATAAGFTIMDDPPETGSSPWSSFAYDRALDRIYIGTGNSEYKGGGGSAVLPDQRYGSGLISLDATTGEFRAFHVGGADDSYHAQDTDVDVPGAPTIFTRAGGERVVCYGSKNGSFWLLDPNTLEVLGGGSQRRQLLARQNGSGHPANRGNPIAGVATSGGIEENMYGVMATPAVHPPTRKIFVGLGGYSGAGDGTQSPFVRALDWHTLDDAWPTAVVGGVTKYTMAQPPLYFGRNEAALSSPAVVNDVVFVSTTDPQLSRMRLYALDVGTGLCLWAAPIVSGGGWPNYALGPAISGEYVAAGAGNSLYIYTRPGTPWCLRWPIDVYERPDRWWWKWAATEVPL